MAERIPSWKLPQQRQQYQQQQQQPQYFQRQQQQQHNSYQHHQPHHNAFGQAVFNRPIDIPPPPGFNALESYASNVETSWTPLRPQQRAAGFTNAAGRSWSAQHSPLGGLLAYPENYSLQQQQQRQHHHQQQQQQQQQRTHRRLPSSAVWPSRVLDMSSHYTDDGSASSGYQSGYPFPSSPAVVVSPAAVSPAVASLSLSPVDGIFSMTPTLAAQPESLAISKTRRACAPDLAQQMQGLAISAQNRAADRMRSAEFAGSVSPIFPISPSFAAPMASSVASGSFLLPPPQQPPQRASSAVSATASSPLSTHETADEANSAIFASSPVPGETARSPVTAAPPTTTTTTEAKTEADVVTTATTAGPLVLAPSLPGPPAPGFQLPQTGYEFELNHAANLQELQRQQVWARVQLSSCNENARFQHTQTTACIAAINGRIIGNYTPESLWCYGTNPELVGLRVTLTMYQGYPPGFLQPGEGRARTDNRSSRESRYRGGATLVLRHQIVVPPRGGRITSSGSGGGRNGGRAASHSHGHRPSQFAGASGYLQNRRRVFATTIVSLRGGVVSRPGYRPIEGTEATERMRAWGGNPSSGVFGNGWLLRMATDAGRIEHVIDHRAVDQLSGSSTSTSSSLGRGQLPMWPEAGECMRMVNERMKALTQRDASLSILLSNHATQKRMARQCPDLVAMWLASQENL